MTRTRPTQEARELAAGAAPFRRRAEVRVPCGPKGPHPAVIPALDRAGAPVVHVHLMRSDTDYAAHLVDWWMRVPELTIVEHDVEVPRRALETFALCPEPWCCFPYGGEALLGCTRFRPWELPARPAIPIYDLLGVHWQALDMALYELLRAAGYRPHRHRPAPVHHHGWADQGPAR